VDPGALRALVLVAAFVPCADDFATLTTFAAFAVPVPLVADRAPAFGDAAASTLSGSASTMLYCAPAGLARRAP
jgi:hypothetical protein